MEIFNTCTAALFRRIAIPTTKKGWIAVIVCVIVLVAFQWLLGKVLAGTSLEEKTKENITKIGSYIVAFVVMMIILI